MVIIKRFFSIVISIFFICNFSVNTSALTDVTHSAYEEDKLLDTTWYKGACLNSSPTCQKHILKFESVNELIDFFEKKLIFFSIRYFSQIAIPLSGALLLYY